LENPEERVGFKHPELISWIRSNRKRLVASCLTILRAFFVAGAPYDGPVWGSFEAWTRIVPAAIVWAGMPDPMLARATRADGAEPERNAMRVFMHGVRGYLDKVGRESVSARELLSHIYSEDATIDLREATDALSRTQHGRQPTSLQLSGVLRRHRGRVIDHMRVATAFMDSHSKSVQWSVQRLEDLGEPPVSPLGEQVASLEPEALL
jgi:hypothetical protein